MVRRAFLGLFFLWCSGCSSGSDSPVGDVGGFDSGQDGGVDAAICVADASAPRCDGRRGWEVDPVFLADVEVRCSTCTTTAILLYAADVDSDGDDDLVYYATGDSQFLGVIERGPGSTFTPVLRRQLPKFYGDHAIATSSSGVFAYYAYRPVDRGEALVFARTNLSDPLGREEVMTTTQADPRERISSIAVGDFDGDADHDVALLLTGPSKLRGRVMRLENVGAAFQELGFAENLRAELGPLNELMVLPSGQSDELIVLTDRHPSYELHAVRVHGDWWTGSGAFQNLVTRDDGGLQRLRLYDVTGDGALDLVATGDKEITVVTKLRTSAPEVLVSRAAFGASGFIPVVGNFDGQPGIEIVTYWSSIDVHYQLEQQPPPQLQFHTSPGASRTVAMDVNDDGADDLITFRNNKLGYLPGGSQTSAGNPYFATTHAYKVTSTHTSMAVADFDSDGWLDVAIGLGGTGSIELFLGGQGGALGTQSTLTVSDYSRARAADFNGDCLPDLLLTQASMGDFEFRPNLGGGQFGDPVVSPGVNNAFDLEVLDLDGDGILDIVAAGRPFTLFRGLGDGRFEISYESPERYIGGMVEIDDVDEDGHVDFVVADFSSIAGDNRVRIHYGDGQGGVQEIFDFPTGLGTFAGATGDLDGDGRVDLAVATMNDNTVRIYESDGPRSFGGLTRELYFSSPRGLTIADHTENGHEDLLIWGNGKARLFENNGTGLAEEPFNLGGGGANEIRIADFNKDGVLDLMQMSIGFGFAVTYGTCATQ